MAARTFTLPDLGEGLTEAELVRWLVDVGDRIGVDQPVAEVETAKAVVEVPSPFAGTVAVLHGEAGQTLEVGKPLISVEQDEVAEAKTGSGNVLIGYGTSGHGAGGRTRRRRTAGESRTAGGTGQVVLDFPPTPSSPSVTRSSPEAPAAPVPLVVSPLVRRLAREHSVPLRELRGSGPGGLIMRRDVLGAIGGKEGAQLRTGPEAVPAPRPVPETPAPAGTEPTDARTGLRILSRTPLRGVRRTVAEAMVRSRSEIPEATVWVDVDATALVDLREELRKRDPEHAPGLLALIARFVVAGLRRFPALNSRLDGEDIVEFDGVNLGFAAQTDRGLVVPSVPDAHELSARQLDTEIRRLTTLAREGKASPAELTRGTFTLNNYGVFGVDGSAAIINYPEVAILGIGRIVDRPWVVEGALAVRKVTQLALVFDHRVCDGGTAGGFLRYVADAIENPGSILADL